MKDSPRLNRNRNDTPGFVSFRHDSKTWATKTRYGLAMTQRRELWMPRYGLPWLEDVSYESLDMVSSELYMGAAIASRVF